MKKRAMKKYIPKNTPYCDGCKWRKHIDIIYLHKDPSEFIGTGLLQHLHIEKCKYADECQGNCWTSAGTSCIIEVWRCEYLGLTDYEQDTLLWDGCKECGVGCGY